jgi:hypothetical protein
MAMSPDGCRAESRRAYTSDASPDGAAFDVRPYGQGSPKLGLGLAYNHARNEFLVVWSETSGPSYDVLGRLVKMAGSAGTLGDIFKVSSEGGREYLVAWSHPSDPPFLFVGIRGRTVSTDGALGQEAGLGGSFGSHLAVAGGPPAGFLVAYDDQPFLASDRNIYGRLWGSRIYLPSVWRNE